MLSFDKADVVAHLNIVRVPVIHDHTFRALRCARAAAISDEVVGTLVQPATIRIVAIVALMLIADAQIVAHWHSASHDLEWFLLLILF